MEFTEQYNKHFTVNSCIMFHTEKVWSFIIQLSQYFLLLAMWKFMNISKMQFLPLRNSHLKFQQLPCGRNKTLDLLSTSCKCVCETNFFPFPSPVTCVGYVKWFLLSPLCSSINHNLCTMPSKSPCQLLMYICPLSLSFQLLLFSQDTEQRRVEKQHWSLVASYCSTVRPGHSSALNSHSEIQVPFTVNITVINAQTPQLLQKGTECRGLY